MKFIWDQLKSTLSIKKNEIGPQFSEDYLIHFFFKIDPQLEL